MDQKPVSQTIRIAIDARLVGGSNTGDSTYWTCLVDSLARTQHDLQLLLISNNPKPECVPNLSNLAWIHLPSTNSRWWSWVLFPLAARRLKADLIHSQYSMSPLVGNRGIVTVHDVSFFIGPQWFSAKDRFLLQKTVPLACQRAQKILSVSETTKREIAQFVSGVAPKIVVTPNACPPWIKPVSPDSQQEALTRLNITKPYLLTVGTRWARKNMELAVAAADLLSEDFPHSLVMTGKKSAGDNILGRRGVATGYVSTEDLCALYCGASAYLAPSHHEGFGIPLLEAFRTGCPVVSSSGGALPEVAGDAALVVKSWRAEDWALEIASLLCDPSKLETLSRKGVLREREFSWDSTAAKTAKAYREALK